MQTNVPRNRREVCATVTRYSEPIVSVRAAIAGVMTGRGLTLPKAGSVGISTGTDMADVVMEAKKRKLGSRIYKYSTGDCKDKPLARRRS